MHVLSRLDNRILTILHAFNWFFDCLLERKLIGKKKMDEKRGGD